MAIRTTEQLHVGRLKADAWEPETARERRGEERGEPLGTRAKGGGGGTVREAPKVLAPKFEFENSNGGAKLLARTTRAAEGLLRPAPSYVTASPGVAAAGILQLLPGRWQRWRGSGGGGLGGSTVGTQHNTQLLKAQMI